MSGVDRFANILGEGKEGDDSLPVIQPRFTDGGILFVPGLGKFEQGLFGFRFRHRAIDFFQIGSDRFSVLIGDKGTGLPHHMHDTELNLGLGEHRFNGIGEACQPITAGNKDVLDARFFNSVSTVSQNLDDSF